MAKTTTVPSNYDPEKRYDVRMAGVVDVGGMKLRPMHAYQLSGDLLATLPADKIASATVVIED
jgi:hypothetical protein